MAELDVKGMNAAIKKLQKTVGDFDTYFKNLNKTTKDNTKAVKDNSAAMDEQDDKFQKRTEVITKTINVLKEENRVFNMLSLSFDDMAHNYKTFINQGGNLFEYLDLAITSSKEQVKIFGMEAALARKIMYGFLPPGMFRLFNKFSTFLRFSSGLLRKIKGEAGGLSKHAKTAVKFFGKMSGMKKFNEMGNRAVGSMKAADTVLSKMQGGGTQKQINQEAGFIKRAGTYRKKQAKEGIIAATGFDIWGKSGRKKGQSFREKGKERNTKIWERMKSLGEWSKKASLAYFKNMAAFTGKAMMMAMRFSILILFYVSVAFVLIKTFGPILYEAIAVVWEVLSYGIATIWEGLAFVFEGLALIFGAIFGDGSAAQLLDGVWLVAKGFFTIIWGFVVIWLGVIPALAWGMLKGAWGMAKEWAISTFTGTAKDMRKGITKMVLLLGGIFLWLYGFPLMWVALAAVLIYAALDKFNFFADGGTTRSPVSVVGERGPELVKLPVGSRVTSSKNSQQKLSRSGGNNSVINITINARDTSDTELRRIADKIGKMVSNQVNRSTPSRTLI